MRYHRQSEELEATGPVGPATAAGGGIGGTIDGIDAVDSDADSSLMVSGRTSSRVPRPLAWAQLILGILGLVLGATDAGVRAAAASGNATATLQHSVMPVHALDVTGAFGFPIWCSLSMIVSSALALWYANTQLQRMLRVYRVYSLINLIMQSVGCLLLVVAWIVLSQPASQPPPPALSSETNLSPTQSPLLAAHASQQQQRALLALCSMVLTASWLLVLACVSCDWCVGKNLLQVLGIFFRTVFRRSQRDSFSELKRSTNSLNSIHMDSVAPRKRSPHRTVPSPATVVAASSSSPAAAAASPTGRMSAARRPSLLETTWQLQMPQVGPQRAAVGFVRASNADDDSISREMDFGSEADEHLTGLLARHRAGLA